MNIWNDLSPKKKAFLTGTLLLTGTGFACRVLGFFYRIFLSRTIGAEGLGLFHLIHPVYGICFALCAGSLQTALSQCIAANVSRSRAFFRTGLCIALGMSVLSAVFIIGRADVLADRILMEPRAAAYLPLMGISVPFAALHSCINGYYYGMQQSRVPAYSQVAEQVLRMIFVYLLTGYRIRCGRPLTVELAVLGHLAGEMAAAGFTLLCFRLIPPRTEPAAPLTDSSDASPLRLRVTDCLKPLLELTLPLMGSRLVLNLLSSAEAIWIPSRLQLSGLSHTQALSLYGVLTGMAMPFILFPSAISNSIAVLLLPGVAQAQSDGNHASILTSITLSLRYSLYMGILCIGVFTHFGDALGQTVFQDASAGTFIRILAWLCPFLYLATTLGSILNGLGHTRTTFLVNTAAMVLRLFFVLFGIPRFGIRAWLLGTLVSELLLALLNLLLLRRQIPFSWDACDLILKPAAFMVISMGIYHGLEELFPLLQHTRILQSAWKLTGILPPFFLTAVRIGILSLIYLGLLLVNHSSRST